MTDSASPTIVLIHGAFADASSWSGVIAELQSDGLTAVAPPNPLRGQASDGAYVASVVAQIDGPVLLVGHSYGGSVISVAGGGDNVVGLVYVAAFIPEQGEAIVEINARYPDVPLATALRPGQYPIEGADPGVELWIVPESFPTVFAPDVPTEQAVLAAATQRPVSLTCFTEPTGAVAWKTKPSWAIVAGDDQAIHPDAVRDMAKRAGATTTEVDGASHAVLVSQPGAVADVIRAAVSAVS